MSLEPLRTGEKNAEGREVSPNTVDGSEIRHPPVEVGSLSHDLQGFWCRIFSINSILGMYAV